MQDRRLIDYNEYGGSDNTARSNAVWRSFAKAQQRFAVVMNTRIAVAEKGLLRELNPGPLAPEARIMPLDQAALLIAVDREALPRLHSEARSCAKEKEVRTIEARLRSC